MSAELAKNLLGFIHEAEGEKKLLRHSWLSPTEDGDVRRESVAEHTWRMTLMAMAVAPHLGVPVDLLKTMEIITIHDLGEIYYVDHHAFNPRPDNHQANERAGLIKILERVPVALREKVVDLWEEFEAGETIEAKLARALDKLEVLVQHNEAPINTWSDKELDNDFNLTYGDQESSFNEFIEILRSEVREETKIKLKEESGES